jgi:hypothetical protein
VVENQIVLIKRWSREVEVEGSSTIPAQMALRRRGGGAVKQRLGSIDPQSGALV